MELIWDPASYRAELGERKGERGGGGGKDRQVPQQSHLERKRAQ